MWILVPEEVWAQQGLKMNAILKPQKQLCPKSIYDVEEV